MVASIRDNNPVLFIDDRCLYNIEGEVPKNYMKVPIGKGVIRKEGTDVTIAASSYMVYEALGAADKLEQGDSCRDHRSQVACRWMKRFYSHQ